MPATGFLSSSPERQISLPVWASKARAVRLRSPITVSQPLGETSDFTTMGVGRAAAPSTAQRTQPGAEARDATLPALVARTSPSPITGGVEPPLMANDHFTFSFGTSAAVRPG